LNDEHDGCDCIAAGTARKIDRNRDESGTKVAIIMQWGKAGKQERKELALRK